MKFLIDAQLPPGLTEWLTDHGHEGKHVKDVGLHDAEHPEIWSYAINQEFIIITKDEDFADRAAHSKNAPRIVWLRIGNATSAALKKWLTPRFENIEALLARGDSLIEVR